MEGPLQKCFGVAGNGFMGRLHAANLQELGHDVRMLGRDWAMQGQDTDDLDGVIVATPFDRHRAIAKRALEFGMPTFVEKPLCPNHEDAVQLCALAQEAGVPLFSGQILRFFPCFELLAAMLDMRRRSSVKSVKCTRYTDKTAGVKNWWLPQSRFLLCYEGIHIIDWLLTYAFPDKSVEIRNKKLVRSGKQGMVGDTAFAVEFAAGGTGAHISVRHDMFSSETKNQIIVEGADLTIEVIDFSKIKANGQLVYDNSFDNEFATAARKEMTLFVDKAYGIGQAATSLPAIELIDRIYAD